MPLAESNLQFESLPVLPATPVTLGGHHIVGGFALSDTGEWLIYGQKEPEGRIIQSARTGKKPGAGARQG
jgi:hypothetical protein